MTFEDVIGLAGVSDPQISPDGQSVAYVVTRADVAANTTNTNIWFVPTAGGEPVELTGTRRLDSHPRWSPDSRSLAFISLREGKPQLYLMTFNGKPVRRLTQRKGGVWQFTWAPDGRSIAYVAASEPSVDDERRIKERNDAVVVDSGFHFSRLWILNLSDLSTHVVGLGDGMVSDPQWSPDSRQLAFTMVPTPKADDAALSDIWLARADGSMAHKLVTNPGPDGSPRWSPDGKELAYLTSSRGDVRQSHLAVVPATGGATREVAPGFAYQPGPPTWSPDGALLYFDAPVRTTVQLFAVPAAGGVPTPFTNARGVVAGGSWSHDGRTVAFTQADVGRPAEVFVAQISQESVTARQLTDHNPEVRSLQLGRSEVVHWESSDGMEMEGLVLYPVGYTQGTRYPLMVQVHGGPASAWTEGFAASWSDQGHVLAGQGWVVFYPNPRGSSGYGERFLRANIKDWGAGDYRDIQTGIDMLIGRGLADSTRLAQSGWSYGGYVSAWTLTQTDRFKAIVVGAGLTDMYSMYATNDLPRTLDAYFGDAPWNDTTEYRKRSAMTYIKRARTPTLIMHGEQDQRVPIGQAQELYVGLKKNGVPVKLVLYPREPHGLGEPGHQLDKMQRENAWISQYTLAPHTAAVATRLRP